jgi:hypothetical protein
MLQMKDYYIDNVLYNERYVSSVRVYEILDNKIIIFGNWDRTSLLSAIKDGHRIRTAMINKNALGAYIGDQIGEIKVFEVEGKEYIKANDDKVPNDNLERISSERAKY